MRASAVERNCGEESTGRRRQLRLSLVSGAAGWDTGLGSCTDMGCFGADRCLRRVKLATHLESKQKVAVKVLSKSKLTEKDVKKEVGSGPLINYYSYV